MRAVLVILVLSVLGGGAGLARAPDGAVRFERWYRVERDGAPIGWMSLIERTSGGSIVTEATYEERTLVMGEPRHRRVIGRVEEDAGGRVSYFRREGHLGATAPQRREPGGPAEPDWDGRLGPSAAAAFIARRLEAGATRISVERVDPLLPGSAARLSLTQISPCARVIDGREIEGFCADWGGGRRVMLDARGYPIIAEFDDGSRRVVFRATSREAALSPYEPRESVADVLVACPAGALEGRGGALVVERLDGQAWAMPETLGAYTFCAEGARLRVTKGSPRRVELERAAQEVALRETRLINHTQVPLYAWENDVFAAPIETRVRDATRRTHERIVRKGFALGLADALTAYMRREGDCTEHAVLLAAMLRAQRVPARVVGGLVPIEHEGRRVLAQHLWVQAFVGSDRLGVWTDLDATLEPGAPLGVRIPLGATGVTDETVEDLVRRMGALAGRLRIEVADPG